jgi:trimeric autotransporter adhesin
MKQVLLQFTTLLLGLVFVNSNLTAQTFTDNTPGSGKIFTVPANVTSVTVAIWGGGGGGGAGTSFGNSIGGGGGGGGASVNTFNVTSGTNITYKVGAAGTAPSGNDGTSGTDSYVSYTPSSVVMLAYPGNGGTKYGFRGSGGSASGGASNISGQNGSDEGTSSSGKGGNSGNVLGVQGIGGAAVSSGNNGNSGSAPGAGGSGGFKSTFGTSKLGGAGAAGRFFVRYITVTGISPTNVCPGQTITITGTNFSTLAGTTVTVAGISCTGVNVVNATTITATVPESSIGGVVAINNANGANDGITITTQTPSLAVSNTNQSKNIAGLPTAFHTSCTNLITTVNPSGANPISGNVTPKVWFETSQPANFVKRHYEITPDNNATTATGRITLYFTQQEFDDYNAVTSVDLPTGTADVIGKANLRIEKYPGVSSDGTGLPSSYTGTPILIDPTDTDIIWNATASRWEVSFDVTGFSGFFAKTISSTLPVNWISVNANISNGKQAVITWKVQELNVANYHIQKSIDGTNYTAIGTVSSKGDGENSYSFTEATALEGKGYYRLLQNDRDGKITYSRLLLLNVTRESSVSIYPNPTKDIINISSNGLINTNATLMDVNGRTLQTIRINQNNMSVGISSYAKGIYMLKLENGETIKLIKQ